MKFDMDGHLYNMSQMIYKDISKASLQDKTKPEKRSMIPLEKMIKLSIFIKLKISVIIVKIMYF